MSIRALTTAALAASLVTVPAFASNGAAAPAIPVTYSDLDLTTAAGARQLDRRLDSAAREVCGMDEILTSNRIIPTETRQCYRETKRHIAQRVAALIDHKRRG